MASAHHSLDCTCCSIDSSVPRSVHQTLEEMDFDREGSEVERVSSFKFLGVKISEDLTWSQHIDAVTKKGRRRLYFIRSLKRFGIWSAACNGEFSKVQSFLEKGTDPNSPDLSGYTALHYASRRGDYQICEYLLKNGANSNAQTKGGATPLHRAAYCGHLPVLKLLLSYGATPAITDDDGATPLHKAAERGHQEVCDVLLKENPALRTVKDRRSRAPHDLVTDHPTLKEQLRPRMLT